LTDWLKRIIDSLESLYAQRLLCP